MSQASAGDETKQTEALFDELERLLVSEGCSLEDLIRTRVWGRDRGARDAASGVRRARLTGGARAASSSYIASSHLTGTGDVALDALALRSREPGAVKVTVEADPIRIPIRYLTVGSLVVLSGVTAVLPTLADQVGADVERITEMLREAGASWSNVVDLRCYLHVTQQPIALLRELDRRIPTGRDVMIEIVEGYSTLGKLVEIEVTATRPWPGDE